MNKAIWTVIIVVVIIVLLIIIFTRPTPTGQNLPPEVFPPENGPTTTIPGGEYPIYPPNATSSAGTSTNGYGY